MKKLLYSKFPYNTNVHHNTCATKTNTDSDQLDQTDSEHSQHTTVTHLQAYSFYIDTWFPFATWFHNFLSQFTHIYYTIHNSRNGLTHGDITGGNCHQYHFCRDKHVFVETKPIFCRDKSHLLSRQKFACRDKKWYLSQQNIFVNKSLLLSRQTRVCRDKNDTCGSSRH